MVGHGLLGIRPSNYNGSNIRVSKMSKLCEVCGVTIVTEILCARCIELLGNEEDYTDPQMDLFGDD